jgi:hypothetical protein
MGSGPSRARNQESNRGWGRDWDRGHRDRFDARRHEFQNWYLNYYPAWLGYGDPYLLDPGFYDWGDSDDDSAYDQGGPAPDAAPYPDYGAPGESAQQQGPPGPQGPEGPQADMQVWNAPNAPAGYGVPAESPQQGYPGRIPVWNAPNVTEPSSQRAPSGPIPLPMPQPGRPLTVIFKSGRSPVKMQNYMMTDKSLTDLDSEHYEEIPLDQVDLAATQQANSSAGVQFQVPSASRD